MGEAVPLLRPGSRWRCTDRRDGHACNVVVVERLSASGAGVYFWPTSRGTSRAHRNRRFRVSLDTFLSRYAPLGARGTGGGRRARPAARTPRPAAGADSVPPGAAGRVKQWVAALRAQECVRRRR
jgi:hypothetical protein